MFDFSLLCLCLITLGVLVLTAIALVNCCLVPKLRPQSTTTNNTTKSPLVSCLIPARNEAQRIGPTLEALIKQTYHNLEILVLDDASTDATSARAWAALRNSPHPCRVIAGGQLPQGWLGKNFACHQLAEQAQGELLLFLDADVTLEPFVVRSLVENYNHQPFALLSCFPQQLCYTLAEKLLVPLMELFLYTCAPVPLFNVISNSSLVAANGQFMCFERNAYRNSGGHAAVKDNVVEDVALARNVKKQRGQIRLIAGQGAIYCRMYRSFTEIRRGFGKNIYAACGYRGRNLLLFVIVALTLLLAPYGLLSFSPWFLLPLSLIVLTRIILALNFAQPLLVSVTLHPFAVLLGAVVCLYSWYWYTFKTPTWKERHIS